MPSIPRSAALHGAGNIAATADGRQRAANLHGTGPVSAVARMYKINVTDSQGGTGTLSVKVAQIVKVNATLSGSGQVALVNAVQLVFFPVTGHFNAVADPSISGVLNIPVIQPINALVTFTPRLDKGRLLYVSNYLVTNAYNALQQITLIGNVTGGTWTLSFGSATTDPLVWDITPTDLQTALAALPTIGPQNVIVEVGLSPLSYNVEFTNALGQQFMPPMVGNGDGLINPQGPGFCEVTTTVTLLGSEQIVADTAIALPPLTARIWDGVLSTIDRTDTPGFELTANAPALNVGGDLIYDVFFSKITFNEAEQTLAPFAFVAPVDATPVCITDPALEKLPYNAPSTTNWVPSNPPLMLLEGGAADSRLGWRERAALEQNNGRRRRAVV